MREGLKLVRRESDVSIYLDTISKIPRMTKKEEQSLKEKLKKCLEIPEKKGKLIHRLIEGNLAFAISIAKLYLGYTRKLGIELIDLINAANLGLVLAAYRFNPYRENTFCSYAIFWIKACILELIRQSRSVILNNHDFRRVNQIRKIQRGPGFNECDKKTKIKRISRITQISENKINLLLSLEIQPISLDQPSRTSKGGESILYETIADRIQDPNTPSQIAILIEERLKQLVRAALQELNPIERKIIIWRFGLDGSTRKTLEEIGFSLGYTKERIRQIEKKALHKLATGRYSVPLRSYLYHLPGRQET